MDDPHPWWLWPNLLSLDAPAVAIIWQAFLASAEGVDVPIAAIGSLALTVWGIYLADRWLDVRSHRQNDTDRHRFVARHERTIAGLALIALLTAGTVAVAGLPNPYLEVGSVIAIISIGYFALVHLVLARRTILRGLKEASVGVMFALGVAIPLIVGKTQTTHEGVAAGIAFGGLCGLNCILISRWEDDPSSAPPLWTALVASGVTAGAAFAAKSPVAAAIWASLGMLIGLVLLRTRISSRGFRVLADAALFSPLVVVVLV